MKFTYKFTAAKPGVVALCRSAWIEIAPVVTINLTATVVALCRSAWIEILKGCSLTFIPEVALCRSAWIEILGHTGSEPRQGVALCRSAWIEIRNSGLSLSRLPKSHSAGVRGLKLPLLPRQINFNRRRTLQECVD